MVAFEGGSEVRDVPRPKPAADEVLVRVRAAGINPGENAIRIGVFRDQWPATFPSGQGSDLAGVVEEVGAAVRTWPVGDEVIGWVDTRAHGVIPVTYGEGVLERVREAAPAGVDAFVNAFGDGVKSEGMSGSANAEVLAELVKLVAAGDLGVPIAGTYPLTEVRATYRELMRRHTRGKIVLLP